VYSGEGSLFSEFNFLEDYSSRRNSIELRLFSSRLLTSILWCETD
jgi:hypothetical protein